MPRFAVPLLAVVLSAAALVAQEPRVTFGDASGEPGEIVDVTVFSSHPQPVLDAYIAFTFDDTRLEPLSYEVEGTDAEAADPLSLFVFLDGGTGVCGIGLRRRGPGYTVAAPAGVNVSIGKLRVRIRADSAVGEAAIAPAPIFRNGPTAMGIGSGVGVGDRQGIRPQIGPGGPVRIVDSSGPRPVGDLTCEQFLDRIEVRFTPTEVYDSIEVARDGEIVATLEGDSNGFDDRFDDPGRRVYSVVAQRGNEVSIPVECEALATSPAAPAVTEFDCDGDRLSWSNPVTFDRILVFRDGEQVAELSGDAEEYVDADRPETITVYTIISELEGFRSPDANCIANGLWVLEAGDVRVPVDAATVRVPIYLTSPLRVRGFDVMIDIDRDRFELIADTQAAIQGTVLFQQPDFLIVNYNPHTGFPTVAMVMDLNPPYDEETDLLPGLRQHILNFNFETRGVFGEGDRFPVTVERGAFCARPSSTPSCNTAEWDILIDGEVHFGETVAPVDNLTGEVVAAGGDGGGGGAGDAVRLSWTNGGAYERISVERNGETIAQVSGKDEDFVDTDVPEGLFTYKVKGFSGNSASFPQSTFVSTLSPPGTFLRGDTTRDGRINLTDAVATLVFLFRGGQNLPCEDAADSNDDGLLNLTDGIHTLQYLFRGETVIPNPGTVYPWYDPTSDTLGCRE